MDIIITSVFTFIGLTLFIVGFFLNKNAYFLSGFASILILILGLTILSDPITIKTGSIIEYNLTSNIDTISYNYERIDYNLNYTLGYLFLLLGFAGSIVGFVQYGSEKEKNKKEYKSSFDD